MEVHGKLMFPNGRTEIDETLIYATKTTGSKNFYLSLYGLIAGGATAGFYIPYRGMLTTVIASLTAPAPADTTFNIRQAVGGSILHSFQIAKNTRTLYQELEVIVPENSELVVQCTSSQSIINPVVRLLVGKRV